MGDGGSAGQQHIDAGKIGFQPFILRPPGRLPADGRGPITLGFAAHAHKSQMMHASGDAQRGQPIPLQLMLAEGYVPFQHAVHFAYQPLPPHLAADGLRLLGGGQLQLACQNIDAGQLLAAVLPHGFAQGQGLGKQRALGQEMAGIGDAVPPAPGADPIAVGGGKAFGHMLMIPIAPYAVSFRKLPNQLRQNLQKLRPVSRPEGIVHIVCIGQGGAACLDGGQAVLALHVGLVRKNGGNGFADVILQRFPVLFVGHAQEFINRPWIEYVHIGFAVEPGAFFHQFHIGVVIAARLHSFIRRKKTVVKSNLIIAQKIPLGLFSSVYLPVKDRFAFAIAGQWMIRQNDIPGPIPHVPGHEAPCRAGWKTFLVVQPAGHAFFP